MKKLLRVIIIFITSLNTVFAQNDGHQYLTVEKEINAVYQKILREYSSDKEFIKNLKGRVDNGISAQVSHSNVSDSLPSHGAYTSAIHFNKVSHNTSV